MWSQSTDGDSIRYAVGSTSATAAGIRIQLRVLADPAGAASLADLTSEKDATPNSIVVAIGPEGGFSESELEMAEDAAWRTLNLGPRILRIETAAIALAARL